MKINKVKLYNFSSYEGNNEFDFEITDAEKNIVLIGGKNGAGKTSLFTAIKVALYGPLAYGYVGVNSHYISKIKDLINSKAFQQEIVESEVQITLQLKIERDIRNYVITRKWDYTNQRLTEEYTVERDGKQLNDQELSYFENYLRSIIPPDLFEFFLFDGEEVGNIFSTSAYNTYEKYLNDFLVEKQKEDANFAQQLRMPVHKFRKLLMHFSQQLYNKSYGIKELKAENLGTFEEWPFFNDVIMKVMIPAEKEYEEQIFSKNKIDLKESMLLLNDAVNGAFKEKCSLKYKYLFIDEFQDTDDVQIDSFLKLQNVIKDTKLFVVGDLKQSIYRFRGATISAFDLIRTDKEKWEEFSLTINYRTDKRLLDKFDAVFSKMGSKGYLPFHKGKDSLTKNGM